MKSLAFDWIMEQLDLSSAIESCWIDMMLYIKDHTVNFLEHRICNPLSSNQFQDAVQRRPYGSQVFECRFRSDGIVQVRVMNQWELEELQPHYDDDDDDQSESPPNRAMCRQGGKN